MSMAYYHSLGNLRISGLSNKLKNIHDYIDTILQILEWILIWPNSENKESTIMPYIIINTNETNRLYIIKSSQIVSFAFPLNLIEKTTGWKIHCMDLELTSSIITIAKTTAITAAYGRATPDASATVSRRKRSLPAVGKDMLSASAPLYCREARTVISPTSGSVPCSARSSGSIPTAP